MNASNLNIRGKVTGKNRQPHDTSRYVFFTGMHVNDLKHFCCLSRCWRITLCVFVYWERVTMDQSTAGTYSQVKLLISQTLTMTAFVKRYADISAPFCNACFINVDNCQGEQHKMPYCLTGSAGESCDLPLGWVALALGLKHISYSHSSPLTTWLPVSAEAIVLLG